MHRAGVLQAIRADGRRYRGVLGPSWTQTPVCLDGPTRLVVVYFSIQPDGPPITLFEPCKDALLRGTLHLAFTAMGLIDASRTSVDLGSSVDVDP